MACTLPLWSQQFCNFCLSGSAFISAQKVLYWKLNCPSSNTAELIPVILFDIFPEVICSSLSYTYSTSSFLRATPQSYFQSPHNHGGLYSRKSQASGLVPTCSPITPAGPLGLFNISLLLTFGQSFILKRLGIESSCLLCSQPTKTL